MHELNRIEELRLVEQNRLDLLRTPEERNEWGQFATPPALAEDMIRYARTMSDKVRFLDPSLGTGSFYSALLRIFASDQITSATGVELDPNFSLAAKNLWANTGLEVVEADFTKLAPNPCCSLLVANPPYVRHHHLNSTDKVRLQQRVLLEHRIRISGLAGLYCYFMLLADAWMDENALAIWLIPSEFMDVNYGSAVKEYLTDHVQLLHIHRFSPEDVQFADALVSSAVVVFRKRIPAENEPVKISFGGSLLSPVRSTDVAIEALRRTRKWTSITSESEFSSAAKPGLTLGDFFTIKRGIATGANDFFILSEEDAVRHGIPQKFRRPILPNPRKILSEVVEADQNGYPANTTRLALIDCDWKEQELEEKYPQFWQYLQGGRLDKVNSAYLASKRNPWYSQEKRDPAPFLFTYMGRGRNGKNPFRVIWNKSSATAHNVYLLLYPKGWLKGVLHENEALYSVVFDYLREIDRDKLIGEGRVYGGGLHKLEPKELARVAIDSLFDKIGGASASPFLQQPEQLGLAW